jgi:acyl-coenzyme A synthetase/AMP-(fatty) acid ligase
MLMREEASLYANRKFGALRCVASVGEPLNPEISHWARRTLGKEIHDLHVANRVSSFASPQNVVFVPGIPNNRSGKIMRRVLRARLLGQDEGDLSSDLAD